MIQYLFNLIYSPATGFSELRKHEVVRRGLGVVRLLHGAAQLVLEDRRDLQLPANLAAVGS